MTETARRSVVKTLSWRVTGSVSAMAIIYYVTGSIETTGTIVLVKLLINTFLYFMHERFWNNVKWGRK